MGAAAVFLDKDGTLLEDLPYSVDRSKMKVLQGAGEGLRLLSSAGYRLVVVSNQSGVARGYFPEEALVGVETRLREIFTELGVPLDGVYFCPHHPMGRVAEYAVSCSCRKPQPGLILRAAAEHDLDVTRSWMIGDILDDVEAGRRAGCRSVLIDNGNETEWELTSARRPDYTASDLSEAAACILSADGRAASAGEAGVQRHGL